MSYAAFARYVYGVKLPHYSDAFYDDAQDAGLALHCAGNALVGPPHVFLCVPRLCFAAREGYALVKRTRPRTEEVAQLATFLSDHGLPAQTPARYLLCTYS